jgi:alkylation response protein AidB-like acyl-CoA dehydrogenase
MNALLTEKHHQIRAKVREFAQKVVKPVIGEYDEREEFPVALVREMGKLGVLGMHVPEEYGGQGSDYLSYLIAIEEMARVDSSMAATLAAHNSLALGVFRFRHPRAKSQIPAGILYRRKTLGFRADRRKRRLGRQRR